MSQDEQIKALYDTADKFINMANELSQTDTSGTVGAALRYAAARYSSFEASTRAQNMAAEKQEIKDALLKDYGYMLDENLDAYIHFLATQSVKK